MIWVAHGAAHLLEVLDSSARRRVPLQLRPDRIEKEKVRLNGRDRFVKIPAPEQARQRPTYYQDKLRGWDPV